MIGIYRDPPPAEQDEIRSFVIEDLDEWDSIPQRGVMEAFVQLTRAKDFLHSLVH